MSYNGTIASGEVDVYSFVTSDTAVVYIQVEPVEVFYHRVEIHYRAGGEVESANNRYERSDPTTMLHFAPEPNVEYLIRVRGFTEWDNGSYVLRMGKGN
jgi:hypothetical protein